MPYIECLGYNAGLLVSQKNTRVYCIVSSFGDFEMWVNIQCSLRSSSPLSIDRHVKGFSHVTKISVEEYGSMCNFMSHSAS